jgi:hypothetical protein|tara:strand:+ start:528 stop:1364 length:837 start_codon:yes stop_codon:yes gene_type:complete
MLLSERNEHYRDKNIVFYEEGHIYEVFGKRGFTSVTTWIHSMFSKFNADLIITRMMKGKNWNTSNKYWGKTPDEIKNGWSAAASEASSLGTLLHYQIECFCNNNRLFFNYSNGDLLRVFVLERLINSIKDTEEIALYKTKEWNYFLNFIRDNKNIVPYRTEWVVYDEEFKLSGSIDMVYKNEDGTYSIYDWKRTKAIEKENNWRKTCIYREIKIPDCNYYHYSIQLNTYKYILEKHYGIHISSMYLVRLHPNGENYEIHEVHNMQDQLYCLLKKLKCN